jgi:hypothetical protein
MCNAAPSPAAPITNVLRALVVLLGAMALEERPVGRRHARSHAADRSHPLGLTFGAGPPDAGADDRFGERCAPD